MFGAGQEIVSLFGTLKLDDQFTSGLQGALKGVGDFQCGLSGLSSQLRDLGGSMTLGVTMPILGFFGAAVAAASDTQNATAKLSQTLKDYNAAVMVAGPATGHYADVVEGGSKKARAAWMEIEKLNAQISDNEARAAKAKGPHAALMVTIDQEKEKVAQLTAEYGTGASTQREWINTTQMIPGVSGLTTDSLVKMADSFSQTTRYSKDSIINMEAVLTTFHNIGANTFPQVTQAALDMSAAMGQDLQQSAVELGKALADPVAGMGALKRIGV